MTLSIATSGASSSPEQQAAPATKPQAEAAFYIQRGCSKGYRWRPARRGVHSVMRSPKRLTRKRGKEAWRFARCVYTRPQSVRLSRAIRTWRGWRRSYRGWWRIQAERTPYHAALSRLRACESGGRYQYAGAHDGAYQWLVSSWARGQWWVPGRYRTARANQASVDHQDTVTGRFYFGGHSGEWACSA